VLHSDGLRIFDGDLRQLAHWDPGATSHDRRLLATGSGVVLAAEDGLRSWSWHGEPGPNVTFEPWGGGLSGDVGVFHDALWSIHGRPGSDFVWVLSRFDPTDLRLLDEVDLSRAMELDALQLLLYPLADGDVHIALFEAPDWIGNLVARTCAQGLEVVDGPPNPEDLFDPVPLGAGRWFAETDLGATLVDSNTMRPMAWAEYGELFGAEDERQEHDGIASGFIRPDGSILVHTCNGFVGQLHIDGQALRVELLDAPGVRTKQRSMRVHNMETGFRGMVTREGGNVRRMVCVDDTHLLTVHDGEAGEFTLRICGIEA